MGYTPWPIRKKTHYAVDGHLPTWYVPVEISVCSGFTR